MVAGVCPSPAQTLAIVWRREAVNPLQRYERHRKWITRFPWAVGILLALLVVIFAWTDAFTIVTPIIIVLVGLAVHLLLASGKAAS